MQWRLLVRQIVSFAGVGLVATSVHYLVLIVLVQVGGVPPVSAALVGFVVGGIISYALNRKHTFVSSRRHRDAAWRFGLVAGIAFAATYACMRVMVERWHIPYLGAQVVTTAIVMVWTFAANQRWTFALER